MKFFQEKALLFLSDTQMYVKISVSERIALRFFVKSVVFHSFNKLYVGFSVSFG